MINNLRCKNEHRGQVCDRILFKYVEFKGNIEIKCNKCKNITRIEK